MALDIGFLTFIVTVSLPILGFLLRKRIGRWLYRTALASIREDWLVSEVREVVQDGKKVKVHVLAPNERLQAFLKAAVPGLIDWARANIHIKLPPFELPEGLDLKQIGASVLAQKAMSGKKLKMDDAIPLIIGYGKDWLEKSGFLQTIASKKPKAGEAASYWEAKK